MILVRAPLRISFVGGGSDLPSYLRHGEPGHVVSCTIAQSVYVSVQASHDGRTRLHYRTVEDVAAPHELQHDRARAALAHAGVAGGVEIHSIADVPAGSGLGSSSAFTVALLAALDAYRGQARQASRVAAAACRVEMQDCGHPVGYQDAWASALGGIRSYAFSDNGQVESELLSVNYPALIERLWLLPVGGTHDASQILRAQGENMHTRDATHTLVRLSYEFSTALHAGDLDACGEIIGRAWKVKQRLAPGITTPAIDAAVSQAYAAGAQGVKLCGAGGAGFLLCWMPEGRAMPGAAPVQMHNQGVQVVYHDGSVLPRPPLANRHVGGWL